MYAKKEKIYPAYVSKHNSNSEKQVLILMISNGEKHGEAKSEFRWHYLAVKRLSAFLWLVLMLIIFWLSQTWPVSPRG